MLSTTNIARHHVIQRFDPDPVSMPTLPTAPFVAAIHHTAFEEEAQGPLEVILALTQDLVLALFQIGVLLNRGGKLFGLVVQ